MFEAMLDQVRGESSRLCDESLGGCSDLFRKAQILARTESSQCLECRAAYVRFIVVDDAPESGERFPPAEAPQTGDGGSPDGDGAGPVSEDSHQVVGCARPTGLGQPSNGTGGTNLRICLVDGASQATQR